MERAHATGDTKTRKQPHNGRNPAKHNERRLNCAKKHEAAAIEEVLHGGLADGGGGHLLLAVSVLRRVLPAGPVTGATGTYQ